MLNCSFFMYKILYSFCVGQSAGNRELAVSPSGTSVYILLWSKIFYPILLQSKIYTKKVNIFSLFPISMILLSIVFLHRPLQLLF
jgi:hypothetical protein